MPIQDAEKRKAADRERSKRRRADARADEKGGRTPIRADETRKRSALGGQRSAPDVRPNVTPEEQAMVDKWGPLAAYMERYPGRIEAISKSLAEGKVSAGVRFGWSGPTFEELGKVLG